MLALRSYRVEDETAVVDLWRRCGLIHPSNDPRKDILRKSKVRPDLFLVGTCNDSIVASVMVGYEGHRGWINYLAVCPDHQKRGFGRIMMEEAERLLRAEGCPKINLQVRSSNAGVIAFYQSIGFLKDEVVSLGKRLEVDLQTPAGDTSANTVVPRSAGKQLTFRLATPADAALLGELNHQLIEDEGHRNPMLVAELEERMRKWLESGYRAVIFERESTVAAYALYREQSDLIYLRQFFVQRGLRRTGIGRKCMDILFSEIWPQDKRITVDVLCNNAGGISFWRSVGFSDYCRTLEIQPGPNARRGK